MIGVYQMNIDYDEIRAKQQAATPGPWRMLWSGGDTARISTKRDVGLHIANVYDGGDFTANPKPRQTLANAEYIAAVSPDVVGALLDRIENQDDEIQRLRRGLLAINVSDRERNCGHEEQACEVLYPTKWRPGMTARKPAEEKPTGPACPVCNGTGLIRVTDKYRKTCQACHGTKVQS